MGKSVHYKDTSRLDKARNQCLLNKEGSSRPVPIEKVIEYTNECLKGLGMKSTEKPKVNLIFNDKADIGCRIQRKKDKKQISYVYKEIKEKYSLEDKRDIVWMKFTKDGFLGVVAVSTDINFDIPMSINEYNKKKRKGKWLHNTSGILVHSVGKKWDRSFVLIFPLCGIPKGYNRSKVEKEIGNYLIDKGVQIIDFYSHLY